MSEERKVEPVSEKSLAESVADTRRIAERVLGPPADYEWRAGYASRALSVALRFGGELVVSAPGGGIATSDPATKYAIGAFALRGYFTWDMVDLVRQEARDCRSGLYDGLGVPPQLADRWDAIADAIEAILPPRDTEAP